MANLDQDVINLAKAIRQVESGNRPVSGASGELASRYQYMPGTWKSTAAKYLGSADAPLTLENENKATYLKIKAWKDAGYTPPQIASMWNAGPGRPDAYKQNWKGTNSQGIKFDTPGYVQKVGSEYQKLKGSTTTTSRPPAPAAFSQSQNRQKDIQTADQYGALFTPNTQSPNLISEGLKTVGNVPSSAWNFVKGAFDMLNPLATFDRLKSIPGEIMGLAKESQAAGIEPGGLLAGELGKTAYEFIPEAARSAGEAGVDYLKGDTSAGDEKLQQTQRALVSDPVGQIAPFLLGSRAVAEKAGFGAQFDRTISKVAEPVTNFGRGAGSNAASTARFGVGQAIGRQPETIRAITREPESFSKRSQATIDRLALGQEIQSAINRRSSSLAETGRAYNPIRQSGAVVSVAKDWLGSTIRELTGLKISKDGKITGSASSKLRDGSDVRAVQHIYNTYKPAFKRGTITADEFLNLRTDLSGLSRFERQIGKSEPVENFAKAMRRELNKEYRGQVKGLKKLDENFGPQRNDLNRISKGLVTRDGNLTDAAINRIANATGKGKDFLLQRLEEASPGITQKIKVLKAVEDIQAASGIKVGTYSRGAAIGAGFVFGGPLQAVLTAILTSPQFAVPMLRALGLLNNSTFVRTLIQQLRSINEIPNGLATASSGPGNSKIPPPKVRAVIEKGVSKKPNTSASDYLKKKVNKENFPLSLGTKDVSAGALVPKKVKNLTINSLDDVATKMEKTGSAVIAKGDGFRLGIKDEGDFVVVKADPGGLVSTKVSLPSRSFPDVETALRSVSEAFQKNGYETPQRTFTGQEMLDRVSASAFSPKALGEAATPSKTVGPKIGAGTISKAADPLIAEARKFKTAEEFASVPGVKSENITKMKLFGSVAEGKSTLKSDIDILVYVKDGFDQPKIIDKGRMSFMVANESYAGEVLKAVRKEGVMLKENRGVIKDLTKSQLTDIWKQANKAETEASLVAEARKYKSADEFVEAPVKTFYHGTQAPEFKQFKGVTYLTDDPKEALGFAQGQHLGGGRGGASRVLKVKAEIKRVKNIDDIVEEALIDGSLDEAINSAVLVAKKEGYDAVSFTHPSNYTNGDFTVTVPVNNKSVKISKTDESKTNFGGK